MVTLTITITLLEYTSRFQELLLWNSLSACTDKARQNQHWQGNEGRKGWVRETGAVPEMSLTLTTLTEKSGPESSCTTARCGHDHKTQVRTRPCGRWKHWEWGPQRLNQGSNFPCWISKAVVVTDFLCDSYKNGPQNSYTEPQETAILLSHQPRVNSVAIWLSRGQWVLWSAGSKLLKLDMKGWPGPRYWCSH